MKRKKRDKKKSAPKYYLSDLNQILAETRMLEIKLLLHESNEAFRMLRQAKKTRPEEPDCEKEAE